MPWRKPSSATRQDLPPRPAGELLWVHATNCERYLALCDIGHRLKSLRPDLTVMLTCEEPLCGLPVPDGCDLAAGALPPEQTAEVRAFLDHWQPSLCLWTGGNLRPILLRQCGERGVGMLLVDIEAEELPTRKSRWLPDTSRKLLDRFSEILTPSPTARDLLGRAGITAAKVTLTSHLRHSSTPPSCHEDELNCLQSDLGSRPVWLSAHSEIAELQTILTAHRNALRLLHRLLLVVSVEHYDDLDVVRDRLRDSGLRVADWEAGEEVDDNIQVLLTCDEDLGLWYRIAPLSLLAGTLDRNSRGHNPLNAAALGSAIVHGPGISDHTTSYQRLTEAGAALQIHDEDDLTVEIIRLSAPDKAAAMALAGWQVVTEGAHVTDQLLDRIQDRLDLHEKNHATP